MRSKDATMALLASSVNTLTSAPSQHTRQPQPELQNRAIIQFSMGQVHVEQRNGGYYVAGTRVSLDAIVYALRAGEAPETIERSFLTLSQEQVKGAIAFYWSHQSEVDANIAEGERKFDEEVPPLSQTQPELFARLQRSREHLSKRS